MISIIDVDNIKKKSKRRFIAHIIFISVLSIAVISGCLLLLFLSSLNYSLNLVINIVISGLYVCFLIFYFFNIFPLVKHYYDLFRGISNVSLEHRRRRVFIEEREEKMMDNVTFRVLNFSYKEGEEEYQENLYVLDNDIELNKGSAYSLLTHHNVIVRLEEK